MNIIVLTTQINKKFRSVTVYRSSNGFKRQICLKFAFRYDYYRNKDHNISLLWMLYLFVLDMKRPLMNLNSFRPQYFLLGTRRQSSNCEGVTEEVFRLKLPGQKKLKLWRNVALIYSTFMYKEYIFLHDSELCEHSR